MNLTVFKKLSYRDAHIFHKPLFQKLFYELNGLITWTKDVVIGRHKSYSTSVATISPILYYIRISKSIIRD